MMKQGDRITKARVVTLSLVFVAVIASLAFDLGLGTPSSFGIGQLFLLCPLGGFEALLASKALVPVTLISLAVVVAFALLFGRAWCAWGCPAPAIRKFFKREAPSTSTCAPSPCAASKPCEPANAIRDVRGGNRGASLRHLLRDRRTWVLGAVLVATIVAGLPLFCLVCPVGLTFATLIGLWHLFQFNETSWGLILFPAILAIEVLVLRKWCVNICPISALVSLISNANRTLRPRVDRTACLRERGIDCRACVDACPEQVDPHSARIPECSKCGACIASCPAQAIRLKLRS